MDNTCKRPVFHKQFPNERKAWFLITFPVITPFPSVIMLCHVTDQSEIHWCQFSLLSGTWQKKNCLWGGGIRVPGICLAGQSFVRNWIDHRAVWHLTAFHYQIVIRYVWPKHCSVRHASQWLCVHTWGLGESSCPWKSTEVQGRSRRLWKCDDKC